jgi:hypothetical protein
MAMAASVGADVVEIRRSGVMARAQRQVDRVVDSEK